MKLTERNLLIIGFVAFLVVLFGSQLGLSIIGIGDPTLGGTTLYLKFFMPTSNLEKTPECSGIAPAALIRTSYVVSDYPIDVGLSNLASLLKNSKNYVAPIPCFLSGTTSEVLTATSNWPLEYPIRNKRKVLLVVWQSKTSGEVLSYETKEFLLRGSCGNGVCDNGETDDSCGLDCNPAHPPTSCVCGNGYCEDGTGTLPDCGETASNCPSDCGFKPPYICGDNICYPEEVSSSSPFYCEADCKQEDNPGEDEDTDWILIIGSVVLLGIGAYMIMKKR